MASEMILDAIDNIEKGNINPVKQDEELVTYAYNKKIADTSVSAFKG